MRKTDRLFLICVVTCTALFAMRSISESVRLLPFGRLDTAVSGVAGQPRDVDMEKLRLLLEQRVLSDREAEFYEPFDGKVEGPKSKVKGPKLKVEG